MAPTNPFKSASNPPPIFTPQATCGFCQPSALVIPKDWSLTDTEPPCHDTIDLCPYIASELRLCSPDALVGLLCKRSCNLCSDQAEDVDSNEGSNQSGGLSSPSSIPQLSHLPPPCGSTPSCNIITFPSVCVFHLPPNCVISYLHMAHPYAGSLSRFLDLGKLRELRSGIECEDYHLQCRSWAVKGECNSNAAVWMNMNCPR